MTASKVFTSRQIVALLVAFESGAVSLDQTVANIESIVELERLQLRDTFAGQALQGICAHHDTWGEDILGVVARSWELANEMLKARASTCAKSQTFAHYGEQARLAAQEGGAA